jgi:hypothetical protein
MASTVTSEVMEVPELVMNDLVPSTTHCPSPASPPPGSSRAVVRIPPGMSEPPPASVRPNAASCSPEHRLGSQRRRWSSVPNL